MVLTIRSWYRTAKANRPGGAEQDDLEPPKAAPSRGAAKKPGGSEPDGPGSAKGAAKKPRAADPETPAPAPPKAATKATPTKAAVNEAGLRLRYWRQTKGAQGRAAGILSGRPFGISSRWHSSCRPSR